MYQKYKRTYHMPSSPCLQSDDKLAPDNVMKEFVGQEVVVTEKLDGENTTLYHDYMHARSIDSRHNFTRDWVKKMHSIMRHEIPEDWRFCGENMWAEHSIQYQDGDLEGYFYLFAVYDDSNTLLSYDEMKAYAEMLDLPMPKVLYRGIYDEKSINKILNDMDTSKVEGAVMRLVCHVEDDDSLFHKGVVKWVRPNHVQDDGEHWLKNAKKSCELAVDVKPNYMK